MSRHSEWAFRADEGFTFRPNKPEPCQVCDTCHQYKPMSEVEEFHLKGEWYGECAECREKRLMKAKR